MANTRHSTVIDVDLSSEAADRKLAQLQALADRLSATLANLGGGGLAPGGGGAAPHAPPGGGGGGGGGSGPGGGGGGGAPAPAPNVPPGGGGGGAPALPPGPTPGGAPAPAPAPPPGASPGPAPGGGPGPAPNARPGESAEARAAQRARNMAFGAAGMGTIGIAAQNSMTMQAASSAERVAGLQAAADTSIAAPFTYAAQRAQIAGTREAATTRGIGGGLTAGLGLGAALAFGGPAGMAVAALGGSLTELFASGKEQEASEKAAALNAAGQAVTFRAAMASRRATFDQQNSLLGMYGRGIGPSSGAGLGLLPEESMEAMLGFAGAAGFSGALDGQQVLRMSRSTVGVGTSGAFRGLAAAGAGGRGAVNPAEFIALAQQSGLMGSKADEYLSRIASATSSLAEQGLSLDVSATSRFLRMISGAEGPGNFSGLEQSRAVGQLTGAGMGARGRYLAPYGSVVENSVLMEAMRGGGDSMTVLKRLEGITADPDRIRQASISNYGGSTAAMGFAARGMSSNMAETMLGLTPERMTYPTMRPAYGSGLAIARAKAQGALLGSIGPEDAATFEAEGKIQMRALALGERMVQVIGKLETALDQLNVKVIETIESTSFNQ